MFNIPANGPWGGICDPWKPVFSFLPSTILIWMGLGFFGGVLFFFTFSACWLVDHPVLCMIQLDLFPNTTESNAYWLYSRLLTCKYPLNYWAVLLSAAQTINFNLGKNTESLSILIPFNLMSDCTVDRYPRQNSTFPMCFRFSLCISSNSNINWWSSNSGAS